MGILEAAQRRSTRIQRQERPPLVDRKHARTHGLAGGGGKRLRLYKQIDDVDGAKLWFPQKADKGDKIAFFHIVKKLASEAEFLEYQAKAPHGVEALRLSGRTPWWVYDKDASTAYIINNGKGSKNRNNCRIVDCSRTHNAAAAGKVWVEASKNIPKGSDLWLSYGSGSSHHAKIRDEKARPKVSAVRNRQPAPLAAHWATRRMRSKQANARMQQAKEQTRGGCSSGD